MLFLRICLISLVFSLCDDSSQSLLAQDLSQRLGELGLKTEPITFHQFTGVQFQLDGAQARIVEPKRWAANKPWIWRARFWGHQPALDLALLEHGYGLAYCDVQNLYGSPQAVARWDTFYELMQKLQFNTKPILEGMSRGGLIAFNWAKANPQCVSAIYGDNPVCDIRSWPARHSAEDWQRCLTAYGLTESEAERFAGNPIDGLQTLVRADVPVFLVLGADDQVVPIEDNALVLERRYLELGGKIRKWIKPHLGHHPHGLEPVTPLLNALLAASPRPKLQPKPLQLLTDKQRILLLGDSITYSGEYVSHLATWARLTQNMSADRFLNLGLPSETVSGLSEAGHAGGRFPRPNLHERLARVLDETKPDLIIACYGINCGNYQPYDAERMEAYQAGLRQLKNAADQRAIEVVFVTPPLFDSQQRPEQAYYEGAMHHYANWLFAQQDQAWNVVDVHFPMQTLLDAERERDPHFTWQPDAVHPNSAGHQVMAAALIRGFVPDFDLAEFDSQAYRAQYAITHRALKENQRRLLETTRHRRPGIPGYVAE